MYKVENGKVYEVKEVNVADLEKKVKQVVNYVKQCDDKATPYTRAIATKENELKVITDRYNREIATLQATVEGFEVKKNEAKAELLEMKDVIVQLYPEDSKLLGF